MNGLLPVTHRTIIRTFVTVAFRHVLQFDERLAREIKFRGGESTTDQTSYVAPEALRRMMKSLVRLRVLS